MKTEFTPGPWFNICDSGSHAIDIVTDNPDNTEYICSCNGTRNGIEMDVSEDVANARLIAAAPLLYEACKDAQSTFTELLEEGRLGQIGDKDIMPVVWAILTNMLDATTTAEKAN